LQRVDLREGTMTVFRLVHVPDADDEHLANSFLSSRAKGERPRGREKTVPELRDSVSVYKELEQARDVWRPIRERHPEPRIGSYIAEVRLEGSEGFMYEDLDEPDGHMELWGEALKLAAAVVDIRAAGG
jgi:hypothetical protein